MQINSSVSVKGILAFCWDYYVKSHGVRDVELKEVGKALGCYGRDNGCFVYYCSCCGQWVFQSLGCNSRICSCCGKRHADVWAVGLSRRMFRVPHRHIVLSVASELWPYLKGNWPLLKVYMDSAVDTLNDYMPKIAGKKGFRVGVIVVLHPYGKDMKFQPHLHLIITEGGFDEKNNFFPKFYLNPEGLAKCWKHHVCKNLCNAGVPFNVTNWCYWNKRFYVWVHKDGHIRHPKIIAKYLGRYVRHPAIANSRIDWFDKTNLKVGFHYEKNEIKHDVVMNTDDFITALIQHIPEPQFKMIRYYGAYARNRKKLFKKHLQSSIEQTNLLKYGIKPPKKIPKCPQCGEKLEFIMYIKKPPPENTKTQKEIQEWISQNNLFS